MSIVGISAFYHDGAACLLSNGEIVAATQEERFRQERRGSALMISGSSVRADATRWGLGARYVEMP